MERLAHLTAAPLQRIGLSATQKPIEESLASWWVERRLRVPSSDSGHRRQLDLALELPGAPLEAVMSGEVWEEVYRRLADLIETHQTTLVFVNTRRMAERVTQHLGELLGKEKVTSHHGSLSAELRLAAEDRLKRENSRRWSPPLRWNWASISVQWTWSANWDQPARFRKSCNVLAAQSTSARVAERPPVSVQPG